MINRKIRNQIFGLALIQFVLVACSTPETTPTVLELTATPPVQVTRDILYITPLAANVREQRLDVFAPYEDGSWPVVVFMHGKIGAREGYMEEVQAIAEQGFVVFNVSWPSAVMENSRGYRQISEVLSCAVRYARATAADYGGDPSQIILVGHSIGARMGSWFALAGWR